MLHLGKFLRSNYVKNRKSAKAKILINVRIIYADFDQETFETKIIEIIGMKILIEQT